MMATTTSSSMRVKPLRVMNPLRCSIFCIFVLRASKEKRRYGCAAVQVSSPCLTPRVAMMRSASRRTSPASPRTTMTSAQL